MIVNEAPLEISDEQTQLDLARSAIIFFSKRRRCEILPGRERLRHTKMIDDGRERFRSSWRRTTRRGDRVLVACKSRKVDVDQSTRDLIYGRITSQRSAEMALRHSLSAARSSSLNCVRFIPCLPGVNRSRPAGLAVEFSKKFDRFRFIFRSGRIFPESLSDC